MPVPKKLPAGTTVRPAPNWSPAMLKALAARPFLRLSGPDTLLLNSGCVAQVSQAAMLQNRQEDDSQMEEDSLVEITLQVEVMVHVAESTRYILLVPRSGDGPPADADALDLLEEGLLSATLSAGTASEEVLKEGFPFPDESSDLSDGDDIAIEAVAMDAAPSGEHPIIADLRGVLMAGGIAQAPDVERYMETALAYLPGVGWVVAADWGSATAHPPAPGEAPETVGLLEAVETSAAAEAAAAAGIPAAAPDDDEVNQPEA